MDARRLARNAALAQRMRERQLQTGVTCKGHFLWPEWQDGILRTHHPDYDKLCELLPNRTRCAIHNRCIAIGIATKQQPRWTDTELLKLRRMFGPATKTELLLAFPGFSWRRITKRAEKSGFTRNRKPYMRTGYAALDSVRDRCFDLRLTLVDLDEECGTRAAFKKASRNKPSYSSLYTASKVLDGKVTVKWPDE